MTVHPEPARDGSQLPATSARPARATWRAPALEAAVSFLTAAVVVASAIFIRVNPLDRIGQVSGLGRLG